MFELAWFWRWVFYRIKLAALGHFLVEAPLRTIAWCYLVLINCLIICKFCFTDIARSRCGFGETGTGPTRRVFAPVCKAFHGLDPQVRHGCPVARRLSLWGPYWDRYKGFRNLWVSRWTAMLMASMPCLPVAWNVSPSVSLCGNIWMRWHVDFCGCDPPSEHIELQIVSICLRVAPTRRIWFIMFVELAGCICIWDVTNWKPPIWFEYDDIILLCDSLQDNTISKFLWCSLTSLHVLFLTHSFQSQLLLLYSCTNTFVHTSRPLIMVMNMHWCIPAEHGIGS